MIYRGDKKEELAVRHRILSDEQEAVLDLYIQHIDNLFEEMKLSEKLQVEIETQHLKRILSK
ncbi:MULTISPECIES: hypothetical protein [Pontibacter]|uniref:Uncharacterized protein n=1 Tax=Pontibacter lucknowensis TaxID=1077936 RepID=A0A1N6ZKH0_9BACT|nr:MULTISPECIES: hypothetical protein [Pontibacter]EJF08429.1 hypothetical protein O71_20842 [Pontibacter sp. BAB1700]SIR27287.1 hypothetical protein SAMN05421545_3043 [Pontibacter lucknowensis]